MSAYRIPLRIGSRPGAILGDLYWVGGQGGTPWELFALPVVMLFLLLFVFDVVRRSGRPRVTARGGGPAA